MCQSGAQSVALTCGLELGSKDVPDTIDQTVHVGIHQGALDDKGRGHGMRQCSTPYSDTMRVSVYPGGYGRSVLLHEQSSVP